MKIKCLLIINAVLIFLSIIYQTILLKLARDGWGILNDKAGIYGVGSQGLVQCVTDAQKAYKLFAKATLLFAILIPVIFIVNVLLTSKIIKILRQDKIKLP